MHRITFLKLGGSLITDKNSPHTPNPEIIARAATEIQSAIRQLENERFVLGHGSGSFGHIPARKYQTRAGVATRSEWAGFVEVWNEARSLNQIMVEAFAQAGLPVIAFPPSAIITTEAGSIRTLNLDPILLALENGLIPLIQGDVVFDKVLGGTILSTEDVFAALSVILPPSRILLAGVEKGIWQDFPKCNKLVKRITRKSFELFKQTIGESNAPDVTGGMLQKVLILMRIIEQHPGCTGLIFSGMDPGNIEKAILGEKTGTVVEAD
jgi:isopentenyl phosphate kinase